MVILTLFRLALRYWIVMVLGIVVGTSLAATAIFFQHPRYDATATVFVSTAQASSVQDLTQGGTFTQQIVKSYASVASTDIVLKPVIRQLGLHESSATLAKQVTANAPLNTVTLDITAEAGRAVDASNIANAVSETLATVGPELTPSNSNTPAVKITVIQRATPPVKPSSPNVPVFLLVGGLAGFVGALLLASIRDRLDTRIRTQGDFESLSKLPILGQIAFDREAREHPILLAQDNRTRRAEAFRSLRTNLQYVPFEERGHVLLITSSLQGEGKSTSAANLAISFADSGDRVLLIDGDLREPRLATYLGLEGSIGLSDVLVGRAGLGDSVQEWGGGRLSVLPSGHQPPNPSELLGSSAMASLIEESRREFDTIIIDAPPLLPVTDAAVLARIASGVLLVCSVGAVREGQVKRSISALDQVGVRTLGVVLTKVPARTMEAYGYEYGYRHAEDSDSARGTDGQAALAEPSAEPVSGGTK